MAVPIKLDDFAIQHGVTPRQVQRLVKKYADELDGLYERKGPNGTWLTESACEILRSKMRHHPQTVFEPDPRVAQLEAKIAELEADLDEERVNREAERKVLLAQMGEKDAALKLMYDRTVELQERANKVLLLEADKQAAEEREKRLQAEAELLRKELETEQTRKLTLKERFTGRKA